MAEIDVTELFTDPDFVDEMQIVRRKAAVNSRGENMVKETTIEAVGSIQPTDGKTLQRLPEALRLKNLSTFWVRGVINTTQGCAYPDVLVFKGRRYQVEHVFDWTNWGAGWSEGVCVFEGLS